MTWMVGVIWTHTRCWFIWGSEPKIIWGSDISSDKASRTGPNCTPVRGSQALWILLPNFMEFCQNEVPSTQEMAGAITLCKCHSYVMRRRLSIAVNTFGSDDSIEGFKGFSCKKHGWPKTTHMFQQVKYNVELGFIKPCTCPSGSKKKEILDFGF